MTTTTETEQALAAYNDARTRHETVHQEERAASRLVKERMADLADALARDAGIAEGVKITGYGNPGWVDRWYLSQAFDTGDLRLGIYWHRRLKSGKPAAKTSTVNDPEAWVLGWPDEGDE